MMTERYGEETEGSVGIEREDINFRRQRVCPGHVGHRESRVFVCVFRCMFSAAGQ